MAENNHIKKLKDKGWAEMEVLLDEHLPTQKKPYSPRLIAAAILLLLCSSYFIFQYASLNPKANQTINQPSIVNLEPNTSSSNHIESTQYADHSVKKIDSNKSISSVNELGSDNRHSLPKEKFTPEKLPSSSLHQNSITTPIEIEVQTNYTNVPIATNIPLANVTNPIDSISKSIGNQANQHDSNLLKNRSEKTYERSSLSKNKKDYLSVIQMLEPNHQVELKTPVRPFESKISISKNDKFEKKLFITLDYQNPLNGSFPTLAFGPGLQFKKSKWSILMSAGLMTAFPTTVNITQRGSSLQNQVSNFLPNSENRALADMASPDINTPVYASSIYLEEIKFSPNFQFSFGASYDLNPRWNIHWSIGSYWLTYEHHIYYVDPLNSSHGSTSSQNSRDILLHNDLRLGYNITKNINFKLGFNLMNPIGAQKGIVSLSSGISYTF